MLSMHSIVRRRGWMSAFMLLIVASLLAACGGSTSASSPSTPARQPAATVPRVTITAKDFSFAMPDTLQTGLVDITLTNQGTQPHEMDLLKLMPGKTMQDALAFLQKPASPPPFEDAGGMGALNPGVSGWVKLNLTSGNYVALCFVPDRTTGTPHFALGMITSFSAQ